MPNKKNLEKNFKFKKHKISGSDDFIEIKKGIQKEFKNEEMEEDLIEIYSDEKGNLSDLSEIKIKRRRPFILRLFLFLFFVAIVFIPAYFAFNYFYLQKESSFVLDVNISAPTRIVLGDPFFYEIEYSNSSRHNLKNIELEMVYPENFVFLESYPETNFSNNFWNIDTLSSGESSKIKVKGFIINKESLNNLASLKAGYEISGFSSYFKKDFFYSLAVSSVPFSVNLDFSPTILVGEEYLMKFSLRDFKFLEEKLVLSFNSSENIDFYLLEEELDDRLKIDNLEKNSFLISAIKEEELEDGLGDYDLYFRYKAKDKNLDKESMNWSLKYINDNDKEFSFYERNFSLDIIKSDLHLNLIVNESNIDQSVNFSDKLDYTIEYSNKGDKKMKDVVLMLAIESDFLDWSSFKDPNNGKINRKTITWTSKEIPNLKELDPGQEHEINFSINVSDFESVSFGQELDIKSYAQFTIGNFDDFSEGDSKISDNKSNIIINKINSNLSFKEEIRYFDENNIPVGSGPLPPMVGEKSSFRVYWQIENTLHELKDLKIELELPAYIMWENNYNVSAGEINYDLVDHKIIWTLARLPLGINEIDVNFDISMIPTDFEYNKVVVLSPGSNIEVFDIETNSFMFQKSGMKTTKLEDDPIAELSSDGRIKQYYAD